MLAVANAFVHGDEQPEKYHWENDPAFVAELESRWAHYKNGGKMYSAEEVASETKELLQKFKNK